MWPKKKKKMQSRKIKGNKKHNILANKKQSGGQKMVSEDRMRTLESGNRLGGVFWDKTNIYAKKKPEIMESTAWW